MPWMMISPQVLGKFADKETVMGNTSLFDKKTEKRRILPGTRFKSSGTKNGGLCFDFIMLQE
jgi:hypothetical protein